jgi:pimeloyl-ACP methyl ester carboxylesterase
MTKLFILHGWTYQTATWDALRAELRARGIEHEFLLTPGLTDGTSPVWTLDDYVRWLEEKTAAYDKVILYGHSNGGRISLAYTAQHPEKVERLILEDSAGIPPRGLRRLKREFFKKASYAVHPILRSEALRRFLYKVIRENDYGHASPEMRRTLANLVSVDLTPSLMRITCPTLIIWGALDTTTPLKDGELMNALISGSRLHVISEARHSPHITHAQEVADLVEKEVKAA